jgi:hypothetical protein
MSNPSSIANCSFWLDPTESSLYSVAGGTVSSVTLLRSRMNTNHFYTTTSTKYPFISSNSPLNNKTSLFFNGSNSQGTVQGTGFGYSNISTFTLAAVFRTTSSISGSMPLIRAGSASFLYGTINNNFFYFINGDPQYGAATRPLTNVFNTTVIMIAVYNNSTTNIYANSTQFSSITNVPLVNYNYWDIGDVTPYGFNSAFIGYSGDIITYSKALTDTERNGLYTYLLEKWNFDASFPPIPYPLPRVESNALQFWWRSPIAFSTSITSYTITDDTNTTYTSSTQFSARVENLTLGNSYSFKIFANSPNGSTISTFFKTVSTCVKPQPPTSLSYSSVGNDGFVFSWSNPTDNGNGTLLGTCLSFIHNGSNISKLSAIGYDTTSAFTYLPTGSTFTVGFQSVNDSAYSSPAYLSSIVTGSNSIISSNLIINFTAQDYSGSGTWSNTGSLGSNYNATIETGSPSKNIAGNAVVLDGSTNFTFSNINLGNTWTASVWVKPTSLPFESAAGWVTQLGSGGPINLMIYGNFLAVGGNASGTQISGGFYNSGSGFVNPTAVNVSSNTWYNLTYTWDSSNLILYVSGSSNAAVTSSDVATSSGLAYRIGRGYDAGATNFITGEVGQILIYNRALTSAEVLSNYQVTSNLYV